MPDYFNWNIQVSNHAANESDLLEVFFSKNGKGRLKEIKKLDYDGQDSVKMPGTARAAKALTKERFGYNN